MAVPEKLLAQRNNSPWCPNKQQQWLEANVFRGGLALQRPATAFAALKAAFSKFIRDDTMSPVWLGKSRMYSWIAAQKPEEKKRGKAAQDQRKREGKTALLSTQMKLPKSQGKRALEEETRATTQKQPPNKRGAGASREQTLRSRRGGEGDEWASASDDDSSSGSSCENSDVDEEDSETDSDSDNNKPFSPQSHVPCCLSAAEPKKTDQESPWV